MAALAILTAGSAQAAGSESGADAVLIQPDGKIVAVGWGHTASWAGDVGAALVRYAPDGSLDRTFGSGGEVMTLHGLLGFARAAALQPDGKTVVVGTSDDGSNGFGLVRYGSNGSLDPTFGSAGKAGTAFAPLFAQATAVAIQADGKIVAAGALWQGPWGGQQAGFGLARYDADGSPDTTFGTNGRVTGAAEGGGTASALALEDDGKLLVAGSNAAGFLLARYNADGTLDPSFGAGGFVTTPAEGSDAGAAAIALQPDGRIVVAGSSASHFALVRYHADGSLDPSFGTGGIASTAFTDTTECESCGDEANAVAIQPDGKILAVGQTCEGFAPLECEFALARYNLDGSLDTGFGSGGKVTTRSRAGCAAQDYAQAVALQADGRIVAAGYSTYGGCDPEYSVLTLARYAVNGSLDTSFGRTGIVETPVAACLVPRLQGESLSWAKHALAQSHCRMGEVSTVPSTTVEKGRIVSQRATACRLRQPAAKVGVTVSSGSHRRGTVSHPQPGAIVYDSLTHLGCGGGGSGPHNIFAIRSNGADRLQLTRGGAIAPDWSPDGRKIAFWEWPRNRISLMDADGSHLRVVTRGSGPTFSPAGKRIAFSRESGIWTVRVDGRDERKVAGGGYCPDWSPDGKRIAFVDHHDIHAVGARGGRPRAVTTNGSAFGSCPAWSPNGRQIAFIEEDAEGSHFKLAVVQVSDGSIRVVASDPDPEAPPDWSPAGRVVYVRDAHGGIGFQLVTISATGGDLRIVTSKLGGSPHGTSWRR